MRAVIAYALCRSQPRLISQKKKGQSAGKATFETDRATKSFGLSPDEKKTLASSSEKIGRAPKKERET